MPRGRYNSAKVRQQGYNYNTTICAIELTSSTAPPFVLAMQEVTALSTADG